MKAKVEIVDEKDRNRGLITAVVFGAVMLILLLFLSVSEPDPPLRDIPVFIEFTPEMFIEPSSSGSDGGAPDSGSDRPDPTPPDAGDPVVTTNTPKPVRHNSGQGGSTVVTNPNPPQQQPDPTFTFGGGGSGGSGGGSTGPGFGQGTGDPGPGGTGTGNTAPRKIVQNPCTPERTTDEGEVYLSITIDETGRVVRADNIPSKSTTSSVSSINAARDAVMRCMRYEARPGAANMKTEVVIRVRSN